MNRIEAVYDFVTNLVTGAIRDGEEVTGDYKVVRILSSKPKANDLEGFSTVESGQYEGNIEVKKSVSTGGDYIKELGDEFDTVLSEFKTADTTSYTLDNGDTLDIEDIEYIGFYDASERDKILFLIQFYINYNYRSL